MQHHASHLSQSQQQQHQQQQQQPHQQSQQHNQDHATSYMASSHPQTIGFFHSSSRNPEHNKYASRGSLLLSTRNYYFYSTSAFDSWLFIKNIFFHNLAPSISDGIGWCGYILLFLSYFLIVLTVPFSLSICLKVVQEYERAVCAYFLLFFIYKFCLLVWKSPFIFFINIY